MKMTLICKKMKLHSELTFTTRFVLKQRHKRTILVMNLFLGPDYMSRAASVWAGPVVMYFVAFNKHAEIPANSNQPG